MRLDRVNGHWLRWLRLKAGLTLRAVAKRGKVSHTFIRAIEQNQNNCTRSVRAVYSSIERKLQQEGERGR